MGAIPLKGFYAAELFHLFYEGIQSEEEFEIMEFEPIQDQKRLFAMKLNLDKKIDQITDEKAIGILKDSLGNILSGMFGKLNLAKKYNEKLPVKNLNEFYERLLTLKNDIHYLLKQKTISEELKNEINDTYQYALNIDWSNQEQVESLEEHYINIWKYRK